MLLFGRQGCFWATQVTRRVVSRWRWHGGGCTYRRRPTRPKRCIWRRPTRRRKPQKKASLLTAKGDGRILVTLPRRRFLMQVCGSRLGRVARVLVIHTRGAKSLSRWSRDGRPDWSRLIEQTRWRRPMCRLRSRRWSLLSLRRRSQSAARRCRDTFHRRTMGRRAFRCRLDMIWRMACVSHGGSHRLGRRISR